MNCGRPSRSANRVEIENEPLLRRYFLRKLSALRFGTMKVTETGKIGRSGRGEATVRFEREVLDCR